MQIIQSGEKSITLISASIDDTLSLGKTIGKQLSAGHIVALVGDLGTGKTWISKGIAFGLNVPEHEYVNSPAFDLIHEYQGDVPVYHMDFYRLDKLSQEDYAWLDEYLYGDGVCVIEWADKFLKLLVKEFLRIDVTYGTSDDEREITISAVGEKYHKIIVEVKEGLMK